MSIPSPKHSARLPLNPRDTYSSLTELRLTDHRWHLEMMKELVGREKRPLC